MSEKIKLQEHAHLHIGAQLDKEYFQKNFLHVLNTFEGEEHIDIVVIVSTSVEECLQLVEGLPEKEQEAVRTICNEVDLSTSIRIGKKEYVFLLADEDFILEDEKAVRGLFVHELMHAFERYEGLEKQLEQHAKRYLDPFVQSFKSCGIGQQDCLALVKNILNTAIFALKDVFANTELIQRGFEEELEAYYYQSIAAHKTCPMPEFFGKEKTAKDIADAIVFQIELLPAWLPFEASTSLDAINVFNKIQQCYSANIKHVYREMRPIRKIYWEAYQEETRADFIHAFLQHIVDVTEKMLLEQLNRRGDKA